MTKLTAIAITLTAIFASSYAVAAEPIEVITPAKITEPEKVELGKMLFFEPRLSKSGFISCNSCHNLSTGGVDALPTSIGHHWQEGPINSPTVLNADFMLAQFWDGRASNLKEQAAGPIANPKEMGFTHELATETIASMPAYRARFAKVYGDEKVDIDRLTDAIAAFEKTLVTPNSPFDQYLLGKQDAISGDAKAGYQLFKDKGCVSCHNGPAVGGTMFMKMGLIKPFHTNNPAEGRKGVTGKDADKFVFKVPTLRNIELTYPYFHDGSVWTLEEAVNTMADIQLGQKLTEKETKEMVAFLNSLTGEQPQISLPILPPSNKETPRPVPFATGAK
ncbi:cytochrome-c peroxidase [Shewanella oneidensis MR-1]|uniref:Diheme cytochrome c5 peroxidase CcpA n=1 Tax=Shewanella oneidensis (strain ATCC 700550 / JCM 31522 / CIP 106686 / LMG 19005 / NCIMB 14063 / MR-1) TaxID=211586 RepID=Q8EF24_SHEON|nr:diheme cytochrome c5 peroxidase CcpA [Shewanella oneidensis]AAN55222.1 diheme cytochrome c5 peroxidase CcpA [Shewanella oneidensis MR-1]MDX5996099.1 diheme cytochrome c5 peroxidase CcpA [Shewanella oneidensis]MEE2030094.1 Cytochrome c551 peroxidase [Shewanella oneidensis]QKG96770.1 cytochrome-c peroxidase [Shewanella oneidensis MR-1]